ncbi:uncharacterized protein LOC111398079 [Olea europaea var. sylvestris]|uniref:uncharacterized protein LOC111398079 n=1 Tax=Olea europaea var. sylvestris TaxID=158386 RepID=UPI000C1D0A5B|nr:uncharacterized protein LOC111398079 [Olea europaea var. sylvestris]
MPPIKSYDPNIRDNVRMVYLEKGSCQPYEHDFPRRSMRNDNRCLQKEWFSEFYWFEYSIEKDAMYYLHCYLLKLDRGGQGGGHRFTKNGFRDWKHKKTLKVHVGLFDSDHNQAFAKCTNLMSQKQNAIRTSYQANILEKFNIGKLTGGSGQFQEMSLACPGDTRWGSHLLIITRFTNMFNAIIDVLENISEDGIHSDKKSTAVRQMNAMQNFEFVLSLYFMFKILSITDDRSQALQKKDQDIQNATRLMNLCKCALHNQRENGWDTLLCRMIEFCVDGHILVPNMEDILVVKGRPRRIAQQIDSTLQELTDLFPETTTELFTYISCLTPKDSFVASDKDKLLRLAQFYSLDFNSKDLLLLRPQLDKFLLLVRMDEAFFNLNSIPCIVQKLVETRSSCYFPLVYRLLTLALILPMATASVERVFFAMNLIKSDLRNKMGDDWLNDNLVVYVEKAIFKKLENEAILQGFQIIRPCRMQLSKFTVIE